MPSNHKRHAPARTANGSAAPRRRHSRSDAGRAAASPAPAPSRRGAQHHRSEGHEHPEAHADRQGHDRRRRDRHAQAGADLSDPQGADRAERLHLLGRRARGAARRLRLPARARLQLPAGPGRHLRLAVADPQVRSADRRHRVGADSAAEGRRAVLRADQGRGGQLRGARAGAREAVLREPDAALSAGALHARDDAGEPVGARHGSVDADRQGAARADRRAAAHRQDDAAAEHRAVDLQEPSRGVPDRAAHRRAARRSDRHAAVGRRRGHLVDVRRAGAAPRAGRRDGDREGEAPRRAQEGRADPARFDHAARARLQHRHSAVGQGAVGRPRLERAAEAEAVLRRRAKLSKKAAR